MNYAPLLVALLLAAPAAFAQQMPPLLDEEVRLPPHIFRLAQSAPLYHRLRDTLAARPAHCLRPGDVVILKSEAGQYRPYWLRVVQGDSTGTSYAQDTAAYYLPVRALQGARLSVIALKNAPK